MTGKEAESKQRTVECMEKYKEAVFLYSTTSLSYKAIAGQCGVSAIGLRLFMNRHFRHLIFQRKGIPIDGEQPLDNLKLRAKRGQTPQAHQKYKEAIAACDDLAYIHFNVTQIARLFHLDGTALRNQLRLHYPEIIERREKTRQRLGLSDNILRGLHPVAKAEYAAAVELFRTTDQNLPQIAEACHVSLAGLSQHIRYYHKELWQKKIVERELAKEHRRRGALNGCSKVCEPYAETNEKYREALELYRTTHLTNPEIAARTGVSLSGFSNHLRRWNRHLMLERRGGIPDQQEDGCETDLTQTKRYLKSTAGKYAAAIESLRANIRPVAYVAREFGVDPDTFRRYLRNHAPELLTGLGYKKAENGKTIGCQSEAKYAEAVHLYETTPDTLKAIAQRLGLVYNSLGAYVRRNCPEAKQKHEALVKATQSDNK